MHCPGTDLQTSRWTSGAEYKLHQVISSSLRSHWPVSLTCGCLMITQGSMAHDRLRTPDQINMLSIPDLIKKKRDGETLSDEEIRTFITAVTNQSIQECQIGRNISLPPAERPISCFLLSLLLWRCAC
ncbi:unnamed protein product [Pleuronectes platessa]|uniref:Glycosyl transferase family 3 N-terminal domain-containing protein n=1 Tax=Pleuronectes platessa TaxID=8262 RepID=A0A9N7Y3Z5_PLEPL|nr:unnamed protein product [Pleuronectes platessa]